MSLFRYVLNDLRPLVRMLDEPLLTSRSFPGAPTSLIPRLRQSPSDDPFSLFEQEFASLRERTPALNLHEEKTGYVVEAEMPGVRKEDVEVSVADGGRVLTIEGKVVRRGAEPTGASSEGTTSSTAADTSANAAPVEPNTDSTAVTQSSSEQSVVPTTTHYSSTFSRSISFPRPVAAEGVQAKMENGILSLTLPFLEEKGSQRITID